MLSMILTENLPKIKTWYTKVFIDQKSFCQYASDRARDQTVREFEQLGRRIWMDTRGETMGGRSQEEYVE